MWRNYRDQVGLCSDDEEDLRREIIARMSERDSIVKSDYFGTRNE